MPCDGAPAKPMGLWGEEPQGSGQVFPRQRKIEPSGLCGDEGAFLDKRKEKNFQNK